MQEAFHSLYFWKKQKRGFSPFQQKTLHGLLGPHPATLKVEGQDSSLSHRGKNKVSLAETTRPTCGHETVPSGHLWVPAPAAPISQGAGRPPG